MSAAGAVSAMPQDHVGVHAGFATRAAVAVLDLYKRFVSPFLPPACRFHPTCSMYAREAISRHGLGRGSALALRRLSKCHPFHEGGIDPVP